MHLYTSAAATCAVDGNGHKCVDVTEGELNVIVGIRGRGRLGVSTSQLQFIIIEKTLVGGWATAWLRV